MSGVPFTGDYIQCSKCLGSGWVKLAKALPTDEKPKQAKRTVAKSESKDTV